MISVVIPVYNGENYIDKCLTNILNQTYKNLEILIINDGSTDNTSKILEKYKDKRIRIINQKNMGLTMSRNVGLDNFRGDYLYFVDVDDYIEPDTIEYLYNLSIKYSSDIATCRCIDVYNFNKVIKHKKEKISVISGEDMIKKVLISRNREVAAWNKLISRKVVKDIRLEKRINDDICFTYRLMMNTDKVVISNQIKYYYLVRKDSLSRFKIEEYDFIIDLIKAYMDRYKNIKKIYPKMFENEVALLWFIPRRYLSKNKKVIKYLNKNNMISLYNKIYSLKVIFYKIGFKEKIKMFLFRISPRLHNSIMKYYIRKVVMK